MKNASVPRANQVLVVGTTPDYIHWIRENHPGRALFVTDPEARKAAAEPPPSSREEILVGLDSQAGVLDALRYHLDRFGIVITGVACFDCESLELAAVIASALGLDYVSAETVRNCRDKLVSKRIWQENGVPCPRTRPVNTLGDALAFYRECPGGIVLKPLYGSGSELVFRCRTETECNDYFNLIRDGLDKRGANPVFRKLSSFEHVMLAEEFLAGPEYSCDILVDKDRISIIRTARKIKPPNRPFGTVSGYILPAALPGGLTQARLEETLLKGARVLGIDRAICMVDFVVNDHRPRLIELTPRPGGDCLPALLKEAGNLDIIAMTLDLAEKKRPAINGAAAMTPHIGMRIHAGRAGVLIGFNADELADERRIKRIRYTRKPGHCITMPPADYDSWVLGHMIIKPDRQAHLETQGLLIGNRLKVEIAP